MVLRSSAFGHQDGRSNSTQEKRVVAAKDTFDLG